MSFMVAMMLAFGLAFEVPLLLGYAIASSDAIARSPAASGSPPVPHPLARVAAGS
jgi:hypothetical protein